MSIISFPNLGRNHIFFLLFFISYFTKQFLNQMSKKKGDVYLVRSLFNIYIYTISDLFSFILYLNEKRKNIYTAKFSSDDKNKNNNNRISNKSNLSIKYIYQYKTHKYAKIFRLYFKIFLVALSDLLAQLVILIFYIINPGSQPYLDYLLIFNIFFKYLFSRIFLKNRFYKHHYLSFIINIISLLIFSIIQHIKNKNKVNFSYFIFALVMIFNTACYSFENVYGKIILTNEYYLSPPNLLMKKGIIQIILLLIVSIPFFFVKISGSTLFSGFTFYFRDKFLIIIIILLMISNFIYNLFIWIITDKFSPSHLTMANVLEVVAYKLFSMIYYKIFNLEIFEYFIYFLLIIAAAIHNEVIVINFCKLNEHTKMKFDEKALDDLEQAGRIYDDEDLEEKFDNIEMNREQNPMGHELLNSMENEFLPQSI